MRWAEGCMSLYWAATSLVLLLSPQHTLEGVKLGLLQLLACLGLGILSSWCDRHERWDWLRWMPWLPLFVWTYKNVDKVQQALPRPAIDTLLQNAEQALWGCQPALVWSQKWDWLVFSEFLHLCYLTYFLLVPILIVRLLRREREDLARLALTGGVCSLLLCYVGNIAFPAVGPRHLYPPLAAALQGPVWKFCHAILKEGAAAAAAFPSGHCSLSTASALLGWRWDRPLRPFYVLWAAGVIGATVYGRFHYSLDALAGILVGILCCLALFRYDPDQV